MSYRAYMRWEALFGDLQSQFEAEVRLADDDVVADLAEAEIGTVHLADRLRARIGAEVTVRLRTGTDVRGVLIDAAAQWFLLGTGEQRTLVPLEAVVLAWPLGAVAPEAGAVERRLRITHALRALAREGVRVRALTAVGTYTGWFTRVGADHVDLRTEPAGPAAGEKTVTLALAGLAAVTTT
ncbi:MAG: hypothetical protein ACYC1Z_09725 [Georgenia sp.]